MEQFPVKAKKVGGSIQITIPIDIVKKYDIKEEERHMFAYISKLNADINSNQSSQEPTPDNSESVEKEKKEVSPNGEQQP